MATGSAAVLHQGTAVGDSHDEPAPDGDPVAGTGLTLADASQITVSLSDGAKPLGEISVRGLRKLLPLAKERGNAALVRAITVVLADRERLLGAAS